MMLYRQYSEKKLAKSGLQYQYNTLFSIWICTGRQNIFTMMPLWIKLHAFEFKTFQFLGYQER